MSPAEVHAVGACSTSLPCSVLPERWVFLIAGKGWCQQEFLPGDKLPGVLAMPFFPP